MSTPSKVTLPAMEVDLSHLTFDSTDKTDYQIKEARIRSSEVYLTAGLLAEMERTWGGTFVAVKTITDVTAQKVYLFPTEEEGDDIVPVRKSETLGSATFSFFVPLQKLKLKLRKDRQIVHVPVPVQVKGKGIAYCFSLAGVRAAKRPRTPEVEGASSEANGAGDTKAEAQAKPTKAKAAKASSAPAET